MSSNTDNDDINLSELIGILWDGKFKIIIITAIFAIGSVFYALSIPNQYKASTLLAPAQSSQSGLSSALGQLGGIASLAGVNLSDGETNESQIAQEVMKSWSFIESFIEENDLAVQIFAAEGWDKNTNELIINNNIYNTITDEWLIEDENGLKGPPSSWHLFKKFSGKVVINEDKFSGLINVSIEYYSPFLAKKWLDLYVKAINSHMQKREVVKVTNNINYLEAQIEKTSINEMQDVFYSIIEEQIKKKMLTEASPDYAFVAVSPSMIPEQRSQPKRAYICIIVTLIGGVLSLLLVLIMHFIKRH